MAAQTTDLSHALAQALSERDAQAQQHFEAARFAAALAVERQAMADALATADARAQAAARPAVTAAEDERDRARAERDDALAERDRARIDAETARALLLRVTRSTSWRLTAPLRRALTALRGHEPGL